MFIYNAIMWYLGISMIAGLALLYYEVPGAWVPFWEWPAFLLSFLVFLIISTIIPFRDSYNYQE
jgi:hypothetical protein